MVMLDILAKHANLKAKLAAIHVHHGLSVNANQWAEFCQQQCLQRQIPCKVIYIHLPNSKNLEAQARNGRYQALKEETKAGDALVFAHHLDDQIETFFLQALRGSGLIGLAAMPLHRDFEGRSLYRPMLAQTREALLIYASQHQIAWVEDESNASPKFSRNFLRHQVLPMIESRWPHYRKSLAQTIASCQQHHLLNQIHQDQYFHSGPRLNLEYMQNLTQVEIYGHLRSWFQANQVDLPARSVFNEILQQFVLPKRQDSNPKICLGQWILRRYGNQLYLLSITDGQNFQGGIWKAFPGPFGPWSASLSDQGLRLQPSADLIEIRQRQGGERIYYRGQHRILKKLLQAWKIPPWERDNLALLYVNAELRAVLGHMIADQDHIPDHYPYYRIEQ